jgi:WD repeat and SOF domain-containing protein 1
MLRLNHLVVLIPLLLRFASVPEQIGFTSLVSNPGLPPPRTIGSWNLPAAVARKGGFTVGTGAPRTYFHRENQTARQVAYPPRPVSGSVADLDVVMDYCDFSTQKVYNSC